MKKIVGMMFFLLGLSCCQTHTLKPLVGDARQQALNQYVKSIEQQVVSHWQLKDAFSEYSYKILPAGPNKTILWVVVDQLGDIIATDVVESAGGFLDREAQRAIYLSSPLPTPPEGLQYQSSRGIIAGFPVQFVVHVEGALGTLRQARFMNQPLNKTMAVEPVSFSIVQ